MRHGCALSLTILMPLLITRTYAGTLLDEACRMAVRHQIDYGAMLGVPWGVTEAKHRHVASTSGHEMLAGGLPVEVDHRAMVGRP